MGRIGSKSVCTVRDPGGSEDKKDDVPDKEDTLRKGVAETDSIQSIPGSKEHDDDHWEKLMGEQGV